MSQRIMLTISDKLAELIDQKRGIASVQEFITQAAAAACTGSAVEAELRRQVDQLHETIRQLGGGAATSTPPPVATSTPPLGAGGRPEPMGW